MVWGKSRGILVGALALSSIAHGEGVKRYLVRFKSKSSFGRVSRTFTGVQALNAPGVTSPTHLLGASNVVTHSLEHISTLVVESENSAAMASLRANPNIALVEAEVMHAPPEGVGTWTADAGAIASVVPQFDRPWGVDAVQAPAAWTVTSGGGARAMVLDTGLDTGHPAIAANFEKGRNFTDDGTATDITDKVGHGTHVSGTMVASGLNGGLVGVAPSAHLLMGKVCTHEGCSSVAIAQGLNWAVSEHVDTVNMSLSGMFLTEGEAAALADAEAANVFIAAASGNDGVAYIGYPAAEPTVLAVGAVDHTLTRADFSQYGPELGIVGPGVEVYSSVPRGTGRAAVAEIAGQVIKANSFSGSPVGEVKATELVDVGLGRPEDYKTTDVRGKIAFIQRGEITFKDKMANAVSAGAVGVIVFNNAPGLMNGEIADKGHEAPLPAVLIDQASGEQARAAIRVGQRLTGGCGTVRADYASMQGTSMATPHVAAVATLVKAANPKLTAAQVRMILKSTARSLGPNDKNQYGSGLVDAAAAVTRARQMAAVIN